MFGERVIVENGYYGSVRAEAMTALMSLSLTGLCSMAAR